MDLKRPYKFYNSPYKIQLRLDLVLDNSSHAPDIALGDLLYAKSIGMCVCCIYSSYLTEVVGH